MHKDMLIKEICNVLNINEGMFTNSMISEAIDGIKENEFQEFFNSLMGDEHEYLKPLDRVAKVAKRFKEARSEELFSDVQIMAKTCYDKFYAINAQITDYTQANRKIVNNDRDFFVNMDYKSLKDKDGFPVFTKQDLYVLNELGGGEWLMNIKFISNSKDATEKIERIIKSAITEKYLSQKHEAISHEVRKVLK